MASGGSNRNAKYELSKLLQMGMVAEYQDEFEKLINRVTWISKSLLTSFYIFGLKLMLSIELLRARPTTLGEAFSLARIIEARSLDADEDIGIDKIRSAIDCVFHIGESNEVRSKFGEFLENKKSVIEVVMGGGEALGVYHEKSHGAAEGGRRVLCYVQGSKRLKKKNMEAAIQRRLWDPRIKSAFQDNTLRARWRHPWNRNVTTFSKILIMSTHEQHTPTVPTSAVRNTGGRSGPRGVEEPTPDEVLKELCDKNYHQLLPLIAEKMQKEKEQQDKLNAVKARLLYGNETEKNKRNHEESHYSEFKTPTARTEPKRRHGNRRS
ncbi:hypothetical protein Tco_0633666 [Tanacetum coccineum]